MGLPSFSNPKEMLQVIISIAKALIARAYFLSLRLADYIANMFGYKIFKVTMDNILSGLTADEIAEANHQAVSKPLSLFVEGFKNDTQMDAISRFHILVSLKNTLRKRAGIQQAIHENPDVLNTPIRRPIFVIGFPRTGTTLLYNLLSQDPQFMAPMFWEMITPYPPGRPENWQQCERYLNAKNLLDMRKMVGEGSMDVAHELRAENPEECLFAMGRNFLQYYFHIRIKSLTKLSEIAYSLSQSEMAEAYRHYKKTLQLIGYQNMDKHSLLLKAHVHLLNLDALLEVFPDACLIFTYRPMTEILPSFCSTVSKGTASWGDLDPEFGKRITHLVAEFANRGVQTMKNYENVPADKQPFYNVEYAEMVKDPLRVIRGIYKQYGLTLSEEAEQRMQSWLAGNPQHKHGKHRYSMEEYNITKEDIKQQMQPYLDYFQHHSNNLI